VGEAQSSQQALASRGDTQQDLSAIRLAAATLHEPTLDRTLHQLDGAIMTKL
jgi:hypothetical protein